MPITATRYSFLSKETNVAVGDLKKFTDGTILNSVNNEFKGFNESVSSMISGITGRLNIDGIKSQLNAIKDPITAQIQTLKDAKDQVQAGVDQAKATANGVMSAVNNEVNSLKSSVAALADNQLVRDAKGIYGSVRSISQLGQRSVEQIIGSQLPKGSNLEKAFSGMTDACRASAFKQGNFGKPFKPSISCGGKKRSTKASGCSSSQFTDVINKIAGNTVNSAYSDLTSTLNGLVNMTNFGYSMSMCGVFGALSSGITDKNVLTRAGASIFGTTAQSGNLLSALDLSSATAGLPIINEFPGVIKSLASGIKLYDDTPVWRITGVAQSTTEMFDSLDPKWNKTETGESLSIEKLKSIDGEEYAIGDKLIGADGTEYRRNTFNDLFNSNLEDYQNPDLVKLMEAEGLNNDVDIDDLDTAANDNMTYLASTLTSNESNSVSDFTW